MKWLTLALAMLASVGHTQISSLTTYVGIQMPNNSQRLIMPVNARNAVLAFPNNPFISSTYDITTTASLNVGSNAHVQGDLSISGTCYGCGGGGSSDWYDLTNIPTQVQVVSNSGNQTVNSLSVSTTVSAVGVTATTTFAVFASATNLNVGVGIFSTVSGVYVYGRDASFTNISGNGANITNVSASSVGWANVQNKPVSIVSLSTLAPSANQFIYFDGSTYAGSSTITAGNMSWYGLLNVPTQVSAVSNSGNITMASVSATNLFALNVSATDASITRNLYANNASVTTLTVGSCTGCSGSSSWYGLTNIPTYVQNVSNSTYLFLSGLGVNGTITGTTISASANVFGSNASFTTATVANSLNVTANATSTVSATRVYVGNGGVSSTGDIVYTGASESPNYPRLSNSSNYPALLFAAGVGIDYDPVTGCIYTIYSSGNRVGGTFCGTLNGANIDDFDVPAANWSVSGSMLVVNNLRNYQISPAMIVTTAGNVGLGTATPTTTLEVVGSISASNINVTSTLGTVSATQLYAATSSITTSLGTTSSYTNVNASNVSATTETVANTLTVTANATSTVTATRVYASVASLTTVTVTQNLGVDGYLSNSMVVKAKARFNCDAVSSCSLIAGTAFNVTGVSWTSTGTFGVNFPANLLPGTIGGCQCLPNRSGAGDATTCAKDNQIASTNTQWRGIVWATSTESRTAVTDTLVWCM